jgi:tetratricopeptide (TPR) repeat protein
MAGVYTDNQPDFSFLGPGETKSFSQYWYPIRKIGPAQAATLDLALSCSVKSGLARIGVCATRPIPDAMVRLRAGVHDLKDWNCGLDASQAFVEEFALPDGIGERDIVVVVEAQGKVLLRYSPGEIEVKPPPVPATEPPPPADIRTAEELYFIGLHLEQYRHATRRPEAYWQEAIWRDPEDHRANNALGKWHLRRGEFEQAESCFRRTIARATRWNANPYDGEPFYNLGLSLRYLEREKEAYDAFYKATWNAAWKSAAFYALAQCDAGQQRWAEADAHLAESLATNTRNLNARNLAAIVKVRLGLQSEADAMVAETRRLDALDIWSRYLALGELPQGGRKIFLLASLNMSAGLWSEAAGILERADTTMRDGFSPLLLYALAKCYDQLGKHGLSVKTYNLAAGAPSDYCFPSQPEEMILLGDAIAANPGDARANYYLGNLLYNAGRCDEAIRHWERSVELDASFPTALRNLGIAYFNVAGDAELAKRAFDRALANAPEDARILYERDQLWKRTGTPAELRLAELQKFPELLEERDDLAVEVATLHNQLNSPDKALELLLRRRFQPWEGGEGLVLAQYSRANLKLGQKALLEGDAARAVLCFDSALRPPHTLGEAKHLLANQSDIAYWLGEAYSALGDTRRAREWWHKAARQRGDFQQMAVQPVSGMTYWSALALRRLGDSAAAEELLHRVEAHADYLENQPPRIDYFATSLPTMLLFEVDLAKQTRLEADFLRAQALCGLGRTSQAESILSTVLARDCNHMDAADLLAQIERQAEIKDAMLK